MIIKLHNDRAALDGYVDDSFGCIAGYNSNGVIAAIRCSCNTCPRLISDTLRVTAGALPHYAAHGDGSALEILKEGMFLLDSGGQYVDGTTDTTRTMYLGDSPTEHQRRMFTRVLQVKPLC